jgi:hypothetical protein
MVAVSNSRLDMRPSLFSRLNSKPVKNMKIVDPIAVELIDNPLEEWRVRSFFVDAPLPRQIPTIADLEKERYQTYGVKVDIGAPRMLQDLINKKVRVPKLDDYGKIVKDENGNVRLEEKPISELFGTIYGSFNLLNHLTGLFKKLGSRGLQDASDEDLRTMTATIMNIIDIFIHSAELHQEEADRAAAAEAAEAAELKESEEVKAALADMEADVRPLLSNLYRWNGFNDEEKLKVHSFVRSLAFLNGSPNHKLHVLHLPPVLTVGTISASTEAQIFILATQSISEIDSFFNAIATGRLDMADSIDLIKFSLVKSRADEDEEAKSRYQRSFSRDPFAFMNTYQKDRLDEALKFSFFSSERGKSKSDLGLTQLMSIKDIFENPAALAYIRLRSPGAVDIISDHLRRGTWREEFMVDIDNPTVRVGASRIGSAFGDIRAINWGMMSTPEEEEEEEEEQKESQFSGIPRSSSLMPPEETEEEEKERIKREDEEYEESQSKSDEYGVPGSLSPQNYITSADFDNSWPYNPFVLNAKYINRLPVLAGYSTKMLFKERYGTKAKIYQILERELKFLSNKDNNTEGYHTFFKSSGPNKGSPLNAANLQYRLEKASPKQQIIYYASNNIVLEEVPVYEEDPEEMEEEP